MTATEKRQTQPSLLGELIWLARKRSGRSRQALAAKLGIHRETLGRYERGERLPDVKFLAAFAVATGESFSALLNACLKDAGVDGVLAEDAPDAVMGEDAEHVERRPSRSIPVIVLAKCGLKGWYRREDMAVTACAPPDLADPDAFAVIAVGTCMVPEGVRAGYLCVCSPAATPAPGDLVYLEERRGNASLKIFVSANAEWVEFKGYLPPDEAGSQAPYIDKRTRTSLARIATVVNIKRRL